MPMRTAAGEAMRRLFPGSLRLALNHAMCVAVEGAYCLAGTECGPATPGATPAVPGRPGFLLPAPKCRRSFASLPSPHQFTANEAASLHNIPKNDVTEAAKPLASNVSKNRLGVRKELSPDRSSADVGP